MAGMDFQAMSDILIQEVNYKVWTYRGLNRGIDAISSEPHFEINLNARFFLIEASVMQATWGC